ncbi:hypothetical protein AMJ82_08740 [candidate division TA06 bacterium SM23_40]|uniref:Alanine racemase n=1 Tax=candidate division TA06 bacterium SM23_40 TaxID=1703774 RepID=A0A0S8G612_UNCT6|nr:MAG: hypothetical protein AMJ82_08740 [candidate division TA06 bacterium SM23_40]
MTMDLGRTWGEIDLDALAANFRDIRQLIPGETKIMVPVKADAYGHGVGEVARTLVDEGADMFGVASLDEALELRAEGIFLPILILSPAGFGEVTEIIENALACTVTNVPFADRLSRAAVASQRVASVHIEIDTGMGRSGVLPEDAVAFVKQINDLAGLRIEGIFTHFSNAEDADKSFAHDQLERFYRVLGELRETGYNVGICHAANSAALIDLPPSIFDMVRPGLILYGLYPSTSVARRIEARRVMSLKTRVVHVQHLPVGASVSYGRTYRVARPSTIATISVGYGDGYDRAFSNVGRVLVRGKSAPIVGTICMDLTMVDVTEIPGVSVDDEVVLLGTDGNEEITADELARLSGTISYEIIARIGPRVPRVYMRNGEPFKVRTLLGERLVREWGAGA